MRTRHGQTGVINIEAVNYWIRTAFHGCSDELPGGWARDTLLLWRHPPVCHFRKMVSGPRCISNSGPCRPLYIGPGHCFHSPL